MAEKKKQPSKTAKKTAKKYNTDGQGKSTRFSSERQPSPGRQSAGWAAKKQGEEMMDKLLEYQAMTKIQLKKLTKKKGVTIIELLLVQYVSRGFKSDKMLSDLLNRYISYAPSKHEVVEKDSFVDEDTMYDDEE